MTVASRTQFPLTLGFSLTVHRVQGMTLDAVSLDLSRVFVPGQAYTAVSRVKTASGLNLERWPGPHVFQLHPRVRAYLGLGPAPTTFPKGGL